jgi:hypothetical protein
MGGSRQPWERCAIVSILVVRFCRLGQQAPWRRGSNIALGPCQACGWERRSSPTNIPGVQAIYARRLRQSGSVTRAAAGPAGQARIRDIDCYATNGRGDWDDDCHPMTRRGKHWAGRELDGRT